MASNLGYLKPGAKYAGDAPGNAPVVPNSRMQMLAKNVYQPTAAGDAAWSNWSQWNQGQANQNLASHGITPNPEQGATMPTSVLQGNIAKGPTQTSPMASGYNPRAGRTGLLFGQQNGAATSGTTGTSGTGSGLFSNLMQVGTSINPKPIYSPDMTSGAVNNAVAEQHQAANPEYLMKATDRPGRSRDAGSLMTAMPGMVGGEVGARMAKAGIPLDDAFANAGNILRGEVARDREGLGYANLGARLKANQLDFDNGQGALDDARLEMILSILGG